MRIAFKEWAIIVDLLGRGEQIVILRKGGISEGPGGFQADQPRFLLFPTRFHQQRADVLPAAQLRHDEMAPNFPPADQVRLEYFAEVVAAGKLSSLDEAKGFRGQHYWRDEVIAERFEWGREQAIFALAIRVFKLQRMFELPLLPAYGGCKSWVELATDIPTDAARPVLDDTAFAAKLEQFQTALGHPTTRSFSDPTPASHQPLQPDNCGK